MISSALIIKTARNVSYKLLSAEAMIGTLRVDLRTGLEIVLKKKIFDKMIIL